MDEPCLQAWLVEGDQGAEETPPRSECSSAQEQGGEVTRHRRSGPQLLHRRLPGSAGLQEKPVLFPQRPHLAGSELLEEFLPQLIRVGLAEEEKGMLIVAPGRDRQFRDRTLAAATRL